MLFKKVKVISEVILNEEFNGNLQIDLELDLQGHFKVNFVFLNGNPIFQCRQSKEQKILRSDRYLGRNYCLTLRVTTVT